MKIVEYILPKNHPLTWNTRFGNLKKVYKIRYSNENLSLGCYTTKKSAKEALQKYESRRKS